MSKYPHNLTQGMEICSGELKRIYGTNRSIPAIRQSWYYYKIRKARTKNVNLAVWAPEGGYVHGKNALRHNGIVHNTGNIKKKSKKNSWIIMLKQFFKLKR